MDQRSTEAAPAAGTFQRRFDHAGPLATALGCAAFGAFVLQSPVLLVCASVGHPLPLEAKVQFLRVAPAGIAGSFALARLLTRLSSGDPAPAGTGGRVPAVGLATG